jgi:flavin-dependent thymidylate synthase
VNYNKGGYRAIAPPCLDLLPGVYIKEGSDWYRNVPRHLQPELPKVIFLNSIDQSCRAYRLALDIGQRPEDARYVLPNSLATEVATTYNLRQWRHVFRERALNSHAQWEIRGIMSQLLAAFKNVLPCIFDDLT